MNKHAMILDDEAGIRHVVGHILTEQGYRIRSFASPAHAEADFHPDVIISDLHMPYRTGLDYIRELHETGKRARHVALMSGDWSHRELEAANALGCKVFFKPFPPGLLRAWLSTLPA
ncbi:MAG TPA: response regulator [Kiritimatiellia bacterium]|nr:response regulator [Kiritimatiellia bacterium]